MKILSLILFLISISAFGQNNSTTCRQEAYRYMSENDSYDYCQNVASNCFNTYIKKSGFYEARDRCLNVASSCFSSAVKTMTRDDSAKICLDVNNLCFESYYSEIKDIRATIKRCAYYNY